MRSYSIEDIAPVSISVQPLSKKSKYIYLPQKKEHNKKLIFSQCSLHPFTELHEYVDIDFHFITRVADLIDSTWYKKYIY